MPVFAFRDLGRIFECEEIVDQAHFGVHSVSSRYPVDGALDLAAIGSFATLALRVVDAVNHLHLAVGVLFDALASHEVGALQTDFAFRLQAEVLLRRFFHKVVGFDVEFAAERYLARACVRIVRVIFHFDHFNLAGFPVVDYELDRIDHGHHAVGCLVQFFADAEVEQVYVDHGVGLGNTDAVAEFADGTRGKATAAVTADRRHTRVVPAHHGLRLHQFEELTLTHHGVGEVQAGKFNLLRAIVEAQFNQEPVVQRTVSFEFQRTDRVGNAFNPVGKRVRKVIHRVDAPFVAGTVVGAVLNTVDDRIAHVHVRAGEVHLGTEALFAVGILAVAHFAEELHVLFDATVAVGARTAGLTGIVATVFLHLVAGQVFHVSLAHFDELFGKGVNLVVVVASEVFAALPFKAEPLHVFADGVHVFHIFFSGIRVVEAEVRDTTEVLVLVCRTEVQADRLGVSDVDVAVRFRRETGVHILALARSEVVNDDVLYKIRRFRDFHG